MVVAGIVSLYTVGCAIPAKSEKRKGCEIRTLGGVGVGVFLHNGSHVGDERGTTSASI